MDRAVMSDLCVAMPYLLLRAFDGFGDAPIRERRSGGKVRTGDLGDVIGNGGDQLVIDRYKEST